MIPCNECLILVRCKHKSYLDLIEACSIIQNVLYKKGNGIIQLVRGDNFDDMIREMDELMGRTFKKDLCI